MSSSRIRHSSSMKFGSLPLAGESQVWATKIQHAYAWVSAFFFANLVGFTVVAAANWKKFNVDIYSVRYNWDSKDIESSKSITLNTSVLIMSFFLWSMLGFAYMSSRLYSSHFLTALEGDLTSVGRWITYFGAAPQVVLISILCGIRSNDALVLISLGTVSMMFFGVASEEFRENGIVSMMQLGGNILFAAVWTPIIVRYFQAANDAPWFVHVIFATQFFLYLSFGIINAWHTLGERGNLRRRIRVEWIYFFPDVISKSLICWLLVGGLLSRD